MKFSTNVIGWALLIISAEAKEQFFPSNKVELEAAVLLLCNGTWPGPKVKDWEVQNITNFDHVFADSGTCNPDVEKWEVSQATSLVGMFSGATGFNTDLSKWGLNETADVSNFFDDSCPANASPIEIPIDPASNPSVGILLEPERAAVVEDLTINVPLIPVTDLGLILDRCACDGDLGFAGYSDFRCVTCSDIDKRMGSEGVCVPICPPGAENDLDSCECTSDYEEYDDDLNKCLCEKGAYGDGNGSCKECPDHTEYSIKYLGTGDVDDRCECENSYEVWSNSRNKCICEEGAYGDGDDDCKKCPSDMEADEDGPGTGDKEDRCKCKREKTTVWDDDEEECVCKKGSYEKSKNKCYECEKNNGMEGKDGKGKGDGDIYERCQCISDNAILIDEQCKCDVYSFGDGENCERCDFLYNWEARVFLSDGFTLIAPGFGYRSERCKCAPGFVGPDCIPTPQPTHFPTTAF